jgi:hypothetical protein
LAISLSYLPPRKTKAQCVTSLLTLQNQNPPTHTNTYARTLTNQHGSADVMMLPSLLMLI